MKVTQFCLQLKASIQVLLQETSMVPQCTAKVFHIASPFVTQNIKQVCAWDLLKVVLFIALSRTFFTFFPSCCESLTLNFFFPLLWVPDSEEWICAIALICTKVLTLLPTVVFIPLEQMSTQWKSQMIPQYYRGNSFDSADSVRESKGPLGL